MSAIHRHISGTDISGYVEISRGHPRTRNGHADMRPRTGPRRRTRREKTHGDIHDSEILCTPPGCFPIRSIRQGRRAEPAERIPPSSRADISWWAFKSEAGHPLRGFRPTANFEMATIRGMRPILGLIHKPMLHRVEMDVIHMPLQIGLVAHRMFPVTPLPDSTLAPFVSHAAAALVIRDAEAEIGIDPPPAGREIRVSLRQPPDPVHVLRQHDPGQRRERTPRPLPRDASAQQIDLAHEQIVPAPLQQVHGEEPGPTRNPESSIVRHAPSMPRRDAAAHR